MAINAGDAYVDVHAETSGFGRKLRRDIEPDIDRVASHAQSKLGGAFKNLAVTAGGIFAGVKLLEFGGDLLTLGTQVDTFRKKTQTVFEGAAADVQAWSKSNAAAFGVTDDKLAGLAANFGDLLKPMGFTAEQAAGMSKEVVGLSGALSAWSGGTRSAADVSQILAKAMLGERDSLKELGISITQADVDGRLLLKGQQDLTGAALEQAKATATQELIFEKSADAQKAWADGSMDAVKQQNALKEKIGELKEDLADKLRPAFAAVVGFVVDRAIPAFGEIGNAFQRVRDVVGPVIETVVGGVRAMFASFSAGDGDVTSSGFAGTMEQIGNAVRAVVEFIQANWPRVQEIIGSVVSFLREVIVPAVVAFAQGVADKFAELVGWVRENWAAIQEAISHVVNVVKDIVSEVTAIIGFIWRTWGDEILSVARTIWDQIRLVVETAINLVKGIIEFALAVINGEWGAAWDAIKGILSTAWEFIKSTVGAALAIVGQILEAGLSLLRAGWDAAWNAVRDHLSTIWEGLKSIVQTGIRAVVDFFLAGVEHILKGAARMFGWVPTVGPELRKAAEGFEAFRDGVNAALGGIQDKTVQLSLTTEQKRPQDPNASTGADNASGVFAKGGMVPGSGSGDTVPAWLTPGEYVIRKDAVRSIGVAALERINAQGYAAGGLVGLNVSLPDVGGIAASAQQIIDELAAVAVAEAQAAFDAQMAAAAAAGIGAPGTPGAAGEVGSGWEAITNYLDSIGQGYEITSTYRPGDPGFHGQGKAVDLVGDMSAIFHALENLSGINELFYDPIGYFIDNGQRASGAIGDHDDHVHAATFDTGYGVLQPGWNAAYNGTGAPEALGPAGGIDYDRLGRAVALALRDEPPVVRVRDMSAGLERRRVAYQ